jgi:uncharacterized protein (DUF983 family)
LHDLACFPDFDDTIAAMQRLPTIFLSVIFGRCPNCQQGKIFRTFWQIHDRCPVCQLKYEREMGYFLMAIFIAYVLDAILLIPLGIYLFNRVAVLPNIAILFGVLLVITPLTYRYSRILWLHIDELLSPRENN